MESSTHINTGEGMIDSVWGRPIYVADTHICKGVICKTSLQEAIDECSDYGTICLWSSSIPSATIKEKHIRIISDKSSKYISDSNFEFTITDSYVEVENCSFNWCCNLPKVFSITSSTISFRHCSFEGTETANTIFVLTDSKSSFEDCSFASARHGIRSNSPISIESCRFEHIKDTSIHLNIPSTVDPLSEFFISNTSIQGGRLGLYFQSNLHHLMGINLSVLRSDIGLRLLGAFSLDHCEVAHCSSIGIYSKEKMEGKFGVIADCLVSHCPAAISVSSCDLILRGSRIFRCEYGVSVASCFGMHVHDCIIHDCGQKGVDCRNVQLVKIKKNAIYDCTAGIVIEQSNVLQIENNWLLYMSSLFFDIDRTNNVFILSNTIYQNTSTSALMKQRNLQGVAVIYDNELYTAHVPSSTEIFSKESNTYHSPLEPINPEIRDHGLSYKDLDAYLQNSYVKTTVLTGMTLSFICAAAFILVKCKV